MADFYGYDHAIVINASAATVFGIVDFGGVGELDGDAHAVGTKRTIPAGPAEIVEEMVAREVTPTKMSYSYVIVNEDTNPFQVRLLLSHPSRQQLRHAL